MLLKSDLIKAIKTNSDAFRMGMSSRKDGKSINWQPFENNISHPDLSIYWEWGWLFQDKKMKS